MSVSTLPAQQTRAKRGKPLRERLIPYAFLALPLTLYTVWVIGPMLYSFYLSFTSWDGLTAPTFIGLKNYARLLDDPVFWKSLTNNLKWIGAFITIPVFLGLTLAALLNRQIKGAWFFKVAFFAPMVLSLVVVGLIWGWLYHPAGGLINTTLRAVGLDNLAMGWLSNEKTVLWAIIVAGIWRQTGYVMILYLAGMQSIDPTLADAAYVDGASEWQTFWKVILPLLQPVTIVVIVISIIDSLRAFDLVYIMTRGGPYNSSNVLANFMYIEAFNNYRMGYGSAIAVVLFLISAVFIFFYLIIVMRDELEY
ncbi:multiple sugar transport system permease protein [Ardenticatena maritima]|uniref:ABC transporter permease n=1 Tax=Ardenticatena maritima TaxID=872965 RepID=A0A0M9UCC2_9CHLR|nr:sugar ABC transporter permease [Ardenticatena maritima]KPL87286.1 ABC transporter permease [Ardenticatena maritima]GAP62707.1 multiple sugar transport system permease protein [Ardenticatena maritima]